MAGRWRRRLAITALAGALIAVEACRPLEGDFSIPSGRRSSSQRGSSPAPGPTGAVNVFGGGTTSDEDFLGNGGVSVGPDGVARLAYLATVDSNGDGAFVSPPDTTQVRYVRRRTNGTWTSPIGLSSTDADLKSLPALAVSGAGANVNVAFVFWREENGGTGQVRFSRVSATDPPTVLTGGTLGVVISDNVAPVGISGGAIFGGVSTAPVATPDLLDGTIYAAWSQVFGDDECFVVARYAGGGPGLSAGELNDPNEKTAMTVDGVGGAATNGGTILLVATPVPAADASGTLHAVYVTTETNGAAGSVAVRNRTRTAPGVYSPGAPGELVSDVVGGSYTNPVSAIETDGDVYVAWGQGLSGAPTTTVRHARRGAGLGAFEPDVVAVAAVVAPTQFARVAINLGGSVPVVAYKRQDAAGGALLVGAVVGTANASGPFGGEQVLHAATLPEAGERAGRIESVRDSSGRVAVVYDVPAAAGGVMEAFGAIRPAVGAFGGEANLSRTGVVAVLSRVAGAAQIPAGGRFAWLNGAAGSPREVVTATFTGGAFGAATNISVSATTDSLGGGGDPGVVGLFGTFAGTTHVWWRERLGAVQRDIFFVQ